MRGRSIAALAVALAGCGVFSGLDDLEITSDATCTTGPDCVAPPGSDAGSSTPSAGDASSDPIDRDAASDAASSSDAAAPIDGGPACACSGGCVAGGACKKIVFVTSTTYVGGNLGGLAGADSECQKRAVAAGLKGAYKAWVATDGDDATTPKNRLVNSTTPYVRTDLKQVVGDFAFLVADDDREERLEQPINRDEFGAAINGGCSVWTGIKSDGDTDFSCFGFTGGIGFAFGRAGDCQDTEDKWTEDGLSPCGQSNRLYCFEQ